jgi:hypothetical protein
MRLRQRLRPALLGLAIALVFAPVQPSLAETCTADSFGDAVDQSAAELRTFSAETQPKLKQRLTALRDARKWTDPDFETKGLALVHDKKLDEFDTTAGELLSKIDMLGSPETTDAAALACTNLDELKAASSELMAVMRAKSAYLITKLDQEVATGATAAPPEVAKAEPQPAPAAEPAPGRVTAFSPPQTPSAEPMQEADLSPLRRADPAKKAEAPAAQPAPAPPAAQPTPPEAPLPAPTQSAPPAAQAAHPPAQSAPPPTGNPAKTEQDKTSSWSTTTAQAVIPPPPIGRAPYDGPPAYNAPAPGDPPGTPYTLPPGGPPDEQAETFDAEGGGYSIDEIREATRGFFGTISTSLASVIEHAFQKGGRPTAYVLGTEGGGAFLAGLKYGEGTLYLRSGGSQKVYWHGPSIGYDLGADGSRVLFLIYQLDEPNNIFRRYTGVDGSAYLVGGVGMTFLKGGPVTMAPIRSGLGLRLGANIGYIRFTARPTWNPF